MSKEIEGIEKARFACDSATAEPVLAAVVNWLEKAVLGLNLCPFARAPLRQGLVRYIVSGASNADQLLDELQVQAGRLAGAKSTDIETLLLIHPFTMAEFLDFHFFLAEANALLRRLGYEGVLQIASFHPHYQFAGTQPDDAENLTNRAPYPILHLLREASLTRALEGVPDPASLAERNIETMKELGVAGWTQLLAPWHEDSKR